MRSRTPSKKGVTEKRIWQMTIFPNSPGHPKRTMIGMAPLDPMEGVIFAQHDSDMITYTLTAKAAGHHANGGQVLRLTKPPEETISLKVESIAVDMEG
jgi:hypothetical protein